MTKNNLPQAQIINVQFLPQKQNKKISYNSTGYTLDEKNNE